jgi:cystathionine beta-lyase
MTYDFETSLNRSDTGSLKWDKYAGTDILPMWVADMDFASAPEIIEALHARVDHGVYGYTVPFEAPEAAVVEYLRTRHGVASSPQEIVWLPGLVQGLNLVCRAAGGSEDGVMVNTPVYPPFLSAPVFSDRTRIPVDLQETDGVYRFDREAMEAAVTPETKLFILCNPHNPVGRAFPREELEWLLSFCEAHDLWICSDEIHCDLILTEAEHVPMLSFGERAAARTITFLSASKTYNLPGLACAYAVIPNPEIRRAFQKVCRGLVTEVNCFGYAGLVAAYTQGEPWRREMIQVLRRNLDLLVTTLADRHPEVRIPKMDATYLAWLDLREFHLASPHAFMESHGLGLSNGVDFGAPTGFLRLNFGCPTSMLEEGVGRLCRALDSAR